MRIKKSKKNKYLWSRELILYLIVVVLVIVFLSYYCVFGLMILVVLAALSLLSGAFATYIQHSSNKFVDTIRNGSVLLAVLLIIFISLTFLGLHSEPTSSLFWNYAARCLFA